MTTAEHLLSTYVTTHEPGNWTPYTDDELRLAKLRALTRAIELYDSNPYASAAIEDVHNDIVDEQKARLGLPTRREVAELNAYTEGSS